MAENDKVPFVCSLMIKRREMILEVLYHKKLKQLPMLLNLKKPRKEEVNF